MHHSGSACFRRVILALWPLLWTLGCTSSGTVKDNELIEVTSIDPDIRLDLRYATANNTTGQVLYPIPKGFLLTPTAEALVRVEKALHDKGYGLVIYDAYRPLRITQALWNHATPRQRRGGYVADPTKGSRHNRGCAVDLGLWDLQRQRAAVMPTEFDDFTERAHSDWAGTSSEALQNRERLRKAMEQEGFRELPNEWWHFDHRNCDNRPIRDWVWWE